MNEFGKTVKKTLIDCERTTKWLAQQVSEKTGLYCDTAYISRLVNGKSHNPKMISAIREILKIS